MRFLILALLFCLAACGGGTVNCNAAESCTFNVSGNTVSGNSGNTVPVTVPGSSASSPSGAASSPTPAASSPTPAPNPGNQIPLGKVFQSGSGFSGTLGDLHWTSGGITYLVSVQEYGFGEAVALLSCSMPDCFGQIQSWTFEAWLDDSLDMHRPSSDDAALWSYLNTRVVPKLDAWINANQSRNVSPKQAPYSTLQVPTTWDYITRLAARVPQWIAITPTGAFLVPLN